jgi:hypothetical protein
VVPGKARDEGGADDAPAGPDKTCAARRRPTEPRRPTNASRVAPKVLINTKFAKREQVLANAGGQVRIRQGGRKPLLFAEFRRDLVRRDHVRLRVAPAQLVRNRGFVLINTNETRVQTAMASTDTSGTDERSSA